MTTHPTPTLFAVPASRVAELVWDRVPAGDDVHTKSLYSCDRVSSGLLRFGPGGRELPHQHVDGEHHLWVLSGEILVDDTPLPAGSYIHVPAHLAHTVRDAGEGSTAFYVYMPSA